MLWGSRSTRTVALAAAVAADGYAVLAWILLRYAVAATRNALASPVVGALSLVVATAAGMAVLLRGRFGTG